jgi:hypothetical protein
MQASSAAANRLLPAAEPMGEAGSISSAENWPSLTGSQAELDLLTKLHTLPREYTTTQLNAPSA